jgi:hypothetical protein
MKQHEPFYTAIFWFFSLLLTYPLSNALAQTSVNRIVVENRIQGTRDWLLTKVDTVRALKSAFNTQIPYYARSKKIEGYVSKTSYSAGDTIHVFVSTASAKHFTLDIFRMGYYQGHGGRKMMSAGPLRSISQPTPEDGHRNLRESVWKSNHAFVVPDNWLSGVYLGKLTEDSEGYQAYIIFVIRDDRKADLMFQVADMTWQAYNRWPDWRSLYDYRDHIWTTRGGDIISFDRPYAFYYNGLPSGLNRYTNGSGEFLLWEFPLAFWLEKEGYDVTYTSNIDTHIDPDGLLRAKGFLSVGHDEYWTRQMYDQVMRAREAGLNLLFLGGNSVYGEVFLTTSTDGRPNRIMGRTRSFPDEHALMGATSYGVGLGGWKVKDASHWMFKDTGLKSGDIITDLVGWEYHGPPLRDDPTLVIIAESEMDKEWESEPNTYAATMYTRPKGNFVFNAATCWWNLPLSSPPGFTNPPNKDFSKDDPRVQKMTMNLLDRVKASPWPDTK